MYRFITTTINIRCRYYSANSAFENVVADIVNDLHPRRTLLLGSNTQNLKRLFQKVCPNNELYTDVSVLTASDSSTYTFDFILISIEDQPLSISNFLPEILGHASEKCIFVVQNLYHSPQHYACWKFANNDIRVKGSINLFDYGLLFFKPDLTSKPLKIRSNT